MPTTCSFAGCLSQLGISSENGEKISFHRFPKDENIKQKWLINMQRSEWTPQNHSRLCSLHFENNCFRDGFARKTLHSNAVPTIFTNPTIAEESTNIEDDCSKLDKLDSRRKKLGHCRCCLVYGKHDMFSKNHSLALMQLNIFLFEAACATDRICTECQQHLDTFMDFKKKVMAAQQDLMARIESQSRKPEEISKTSEPEENPQLFIKQEELDLGVDNNEDWCVDVKPELDQTIEDQTMEDQTMGYQTLEDQEKSPSDQNLCGKEDKFTLVQNMAGKNMGNNNQEHLSSENYNQDFEAMLPYVVTVKPSTPPKPTDPIPVKSTDPIPVKPSDPIPVKLTKVAIPEQLRLKKEPTLSEQISSGSCTVSSCLRPRGKPIRYVKLTSGQKVKLAPGKFKMTYSGQNKKLTTGHDVGLKPGKNVKLTTGKNVGLKCGKNVKLISGKNVKLTPIIKKGRISSPVSTNKDKTLTPAVQKIIEPDAIITPCTSQNVRKYVEPISSAVLRIVPMRESDEDTETAEESEEDSETSRKEKRTQIEKRQHKKNSSVVDLSSENSDVEEIFTTAIDQQPEGDLYGENQGKSMDIEAIIQPYVIADVSYIRIGGKDEIATEVTKIRANITMILLNSTATPFRTCYNIFQCFYCPVTYVRFKALNQHTKNYHKKDERKIFDNLRDVIIHADITDLKCEICEKPVEDIGDLVQHLTLHGKMVHGLKDLMIHGLMIKDLMNHGLKDSYGVICYKVYYSDTFCHLCGQRFKNIDNLKYHTAEHYSVSTCLVCDKNFTSKEMFILHLKVHQTEICEECVYQKSFSQNLCAKHAHVAKRLKESCELFDSVKQTLYLYNKEYL